MQQKRKPTLPEDSFWVKAWNNTDCWSPEALLDGVCIICGRDITNNDTAYKVYVDLENDCLAIPNEPDDILNLIGPDCWKQHPEFHGYEQ